MSRVAWARDTRLEHLRTDRRGLPVPWINRWGPERAQLRYDPLVGQPALFHVQDYDAAPDFTAQAPQRQRASAITGVCQVCGTLYPAEELRLVLTVGVSLEVERTPGPAQGRVVCQEPWLCAWCADVAVTRCPALVRRRHDDALAVVRVDPTEVLLLQSYGVIDTYPWAGPVPMWTRLALPPELVPALP